MHIIPLSSITIPDNRQRREFPQEQINELSDSIRIHGLYHPIVVTSSGPDSFRLIAGERRLRAVRQLADLDIGFTCGQEVCPAGSIPCTLLSELDPLTAKEIELEENIIRVDLTWQERATAIAELSTLRKEQHPGHTDAQTARELYGYGEGSAVETVKTAITLSKHLSDPEIAKAKTQSEAKKILQKKLNAQHREKLAESVNLSRTPHTVLQGDSRVLLHTIPDGEFQCIISDPPYGINADNFGPQAGTAHTYTDTPDYALDCYTALAREGARITTAKAHAYAFCAFELFPSVKEIFSLAGWAVWPRPLIWFKGNNAGMLARPDHGPRYTYECILFANKGGRPVLRVAPDVISVPAVSERIHAAEKPAELYLDLLSRSCLPGDRIIDPFAGSGVIFSAANRAKLIATGIELDPASVASCKLRAKGD